MSSEVSSQPVGSESSEDVSWCIVCFGDLSAPCSPMRHSSDIHDGSLPRFTLTCGHSFFHANCLRKWLSQTPSCPVCRKGAHASFQGYFLGMETHRSLAGMLSRRVPALLAQDARASSGGCRALPCHLKLQHAEPFASATLVVTQASPELQNAPEEGHEERSVTCGCWLTCWRWLAQLSWPHGRQPAYAMVGRGRQRSQSERAPLTLCEPSSATGSNVDVTAPVVVVTPTLVQKFPLVTPATMLMGASSGHAFHSVHLGDSVVVFVFEERRSHRALALTIQFDSSRDALAVVNLIRNAIALYHRHNAQGERSA